MESNGLISVADLSPIQVLLLEQQHLVVMAVTFGGMLAFMFAEQLFPNTETDSVPLRRWLSNWSIAFINYFAALWFMVYLGTAQWLQSTLPSFHLADYLPTVFVVALLVFSVELVTYWAHRIFHLIPVLWPIHAVHHMDTELDVTTSQRHHFFEVFAMSLFITPVFLIFGLSIWLAFAYQLLRILISHFSHSNLRIAPAVDRFLQPLIVTPSFHRVHHSSDESLTNSNYGTIVPWFDHLFGTARQPGSGADIPLGLNYLSAKRDTQIHRVLLLPFMWRLWKVGDK